MSPSPVANLFLGVEESEHKSPCMPLSFSFHHHCCAFCAFQKQNETAIWALPALSFRIKNEHVISACAASSENTKSTRPCLHFFSAGKLKGITSMACASCLLQSPTESENGVRLASVRHIHVSKVFHGSSMSAKSANYIFDTCMFARCVSLMRACVMLQCGFANNKNEQIGT
jgi:hypothetical protein